MTEISDVTLRYACRLWGIMPSYQNVENETVWAEKSTLLKVLSVLSQCDLHAQQDIEKIIESRKKQFMMHVLPPVITQASEELLTVFPIFPKETSAISFRIAPESNPKSFQKFDLQLERPLRYRRTEKATFLQYRVQFSHKLEPGYYRLKLILDQQLQANSLLIVSAPLKAKNEKTWALFTPLYALRTRQDWGIGDLGHLQLLQKWSQQMGGQWIGTLPLLAKSFTDEEMGDVSPYSPISRLFWNEIFLDMNELINSSSSAQVHELLKDQEIQNEFQSLSENHSEVSYVDYTRTYRLKEKFLKVLCEEFFSDPESKNALSSFVETSAHLSAYAEFMAKRNNQSKNYHLYVQYQLERQLSALKTPVSNLYLDLPLGSAPDGFDRQIYPDLFLNELNVGAPPDSFYGEGQNWGILPPDPFEQQRQEYKYFRDLLDRHLRYASALRIDHVMGFHRLYVIPEGESSKNGVYLRYPCRDLYAITALEARKHNALIVGEDLGLVPKIVRQSLRQWGFLGMWVLQLEVIEKPSILWQAPPSQQLIYLNTHDMVPFTGFLKGKDIQQWHKLGWIDQKEQNLLQQQRSSQKAEIGFAAQSGAARKLLMKLAKFNQPMIINIEDLWDEEWPQNLPSTTTQYPNWRRRHRFPIEEWTQNDDYIQFFENLYERSSHE